MMNRVLVVAPHPDDEALGCAGTLLRRKAEGARIGWLIATGISVEAGWIPEKVHERDSEIEKASKLLGFSEVYNLRLPTTRLDTLPMSDVIGRFSDVFKAFHPEEVFLPHRSDVHSDHRVVFDAAAACCKWFRYPSVKRVLAYETLSETEFGLDPHAGFQPNYFVDISSFLERKIEVLKVYGSELGPFPFPRSIEAVRAMAATRGAAAGFKAAEAFQLLRERQ